MGKLAASFNWNSGSTAQTDDFAGNGLVSEGMTAITIGSGVVGNTAIFNGASSVIRFGNILNLGGLDKMSCMCQIKRASSKIQYVFSKERQIQVGMAADDTIFFNLFIGNATTTLLSVAKSSLNSQTIKCVYDGISMFIYIDGILDNSKLQSGNIDSFTDDFLIGALDIAGVPTNFFDGEIEVLDCRTDALDADQVSAWNDNPLGTEYEFQGDHKLALGDIVAGGKVFELALPEKIGTVSFIVNDSILRIKPIVDQFNLNEVPVRRGNILDDGRQWLAEYQIVSAEPFFQIRDRIKTVAAGQPSVEASKGILLTKDASIFKNAIILDFVIEPPSLPAGAINDFSPTDLEFATTMYISSDNNSSWNGLLAPVPLRPQWIVIINSGNKVITAKPENVQSLPPNRFSINGNVSFNPNDMGFGLYDIARSRWRLNKI